MEITKSKDQFEGIECHVLNKMIGYIKFESSDLDTNEIAFSPVTNSIIEKLTDRLIEFYAPHSVYKLRGQKLLDFKHYIPNIIQRIKNVHGWNDLSIETQHQAFANLVFPLEYTEQEMLDILDLIRLQPG